MRLRAHDYRQRRCHGHELVCCCARLHVTTTGFECATAPFSRVWSFKLYNTLRIPTTFSIFGAFYLSIRIPRSRRLRPWQQDHLVEPLPYDLTRPFFCMKKRSFLFLFSCTGWSCFFTPLRSLDRNCICIHTPLLPSLLEAHASWGLAFFFPFLFERCCLEELGRRAVAMKYALRRPLFFTIP